MRFMIVHHGRDWPRLANHMDLRECPVCHAAVPGNRQKQHQEDHEDLWRWFAELEVTMTELRKRTGLAEEAVEVPWSWSAAAAGSFDALEGEVSGNGAEDG